MHYELLAMDIDGTLRPDSDPVISPENVEAVRALQRAGIKTVIATGRGRNSIPVSLLNGLQPDYWVCAAGAQVTDGQGNTLAEKTMTLPMVEALAAFSHAHGLILSFDFPEGCYTYVGYAELNAMMQKMQGDGNGVRNGESMTRHKQGLPYKAFGQMPLALRDAFVAAHPELPLVFQYYREGFCDMVPSDSDKANGLRMLEKLTGIPTAQMAAIGDGENDVGMLRTAGLGVCVAGAVPAARAAADRTGLPAEEKAVAALCRELWPGAFA